jgi:hypothetical protein
MWVSESPNRVWRKIPDDVKSNLPAPQMRAIREKREEPPPLGRRDALRSRNRTGVQRAVTPTGSTVSPDELALIVMVPPVPVERTMASTLPLNAFRLVPL